MRSSAAIGVDFGKRGKAFRLKTVALAVAILTASVA